LSADGVGAIFQNSKFKIQKAKGKRQKAKGKKMEASFLRRFSFMTPDGGQALPQGVKSGLLKAIRCA
jgi:hypothetical protein